VSFYQIPAVRRDRGERELELSLKRRDGFLAAISLDDLDVNRLDKYSICLRHFISGQPSDLYDFTSPDWLPMLFLGHSKQINQQSSSSTNSTARYDITQRRSKLQQEQQQFREAFSATILNESVETVVVEEVLNTTDELIVMKELRTVKFRG